jgi:hypothetical protein
VYTYYQYNVLFCDLYPLFILLLLCLFVVEFYTIYLLFVLFCQIQPLDFEINIHNILFHIKIQLLVKNFKKESFTMPTSLLDFLMGKPRSSHCLRMA